MRYLDSFTDFFKSPNWLVSVLLGGVCMAIPMIGPLVYIGYNIGVFAQQHRHPNLLYADFDFNRFSDYLGRGVWPFLVQLVVGLICVPISFLFSLPLFVALFSGSEELFIAFLLVGILLNFAFSFLLALVTVPMIIRAALTGSFGGGFDWVFIRGFVRRMWIETLLVLLFLTAVAIPLSLAGYCLCFVGLLPAMALLTFAQWQLYRQLYELYLQRGGSPVEIKLELIDLPAGQYCQRCGYDLQGTPAADGRSCPECGAPVGDPPAAPPTSPPPFTA